MMLVANMLLALLWSLLIGPFTPGNLAIGMVIGAITLSACSREGRLYVRRCWAVFYLGFYTLEQLIIATLRVAWWTVSDLKRLRPAIVAVPLEEGMSDTQVTVLAALITLTPGTLSLDVSADHRTLFVHFMHITDERSAIADIKYGFERRLLETTR